MTEAKISQTLYAEYISERANGRVIESDEGFIVYRNDGQNLYIIEIYVRPEFRRTGAARRLFAELFDAARKSGSQKITGAIYLEDQRSHLALTAALLGGFKIATANGNILYVELPVQAMDPKLSVQFGAVTVVPFSRESHLSPFNGWFEKRGIPSPDERYLPEIGAAAEHEGKPVACGFLFRTDAKAASIAHLGSDPDAPGEIRHQALDAIMNTLEAAARNCGFEVLTCATNLEKLQKRFAESGFEKTDENLSLYRRSLCR